MLLYQKSLNFSLQTYNMKIIIAFIFTIISLSIFANDNYNETITIDAKELVLKRIDNFIQDVYKAPLASKVLTSINFDLKKLWHEAQEITVEVMPQVIATGSGIAFRTGGVTLRNKIILNAQTIPRILDSDLIDEFFFHETLRALGYEDENYEITTILSFLRYYDAIPLNEVQLTDIIQNFVFRTNKTDDQYKHIVVAKSGTATTVGSGGDEIAMAIKIFTIGALIIRNPKLETSDIVQLIKTPFESDFFNSNKSDVEIVEGNNHYKVIIPGVYASLFIKDTTQNPIIRNSIQLIEKKLLKK